MVALDPVDVVVDDCSGQTVDNSYRFTLVRNEWY